MVTALDALAGGSLLVVGVVGWRRFRISAAFAFAAAAAWFVVPVLPGLALLHRPLLLHSIVALRGGRRGVLPGTLLAVAWGAVVMPPAAQPWLSAMSAVLCLAVAGSGSTQAQGGAAPTAARRALVVLAAGLALPVVERLVWPPHVEAGIPIATYLTAVLLCSGVMGSGMLSAGRRRTDAVIELSQPTSAEAVEQLRALTAKEVDPGRGQSLRSAIALLEDNARLQRDLASRIDEVRGSRTRLVNAAVDERRRLEQVLEAGSLRYLDELEESLRGTTAHAERDSRVRSCLDEVAHLRADLEQLARGLHPRILTERGLADALEELGRRSPVPVEVCALPGRFPEPAEATIWYACAEALANVWKHAQASRARVRLAESEGMLVASVDDDGVGGAILESGGGLMGLVDRLAAVEGSLAVSSSDAGGTCVTVRVPLP